jgi:hypothetical protein
MARKEKKAGPPMTSLVFVGLACLFVVAAGAGYLWNKSQINTLGDQMRAYEFRLETAKRRRMDLERNYAAMCSPAYLDRRVKEMKLPLAMPQLDQIVRLQESPRGPQAQEEKLIAGRTTSSGEVRD